MDVGWHLKEIAWRRRVTLELGGNAAVVVEPDVDDLEAVAKGLEEVVERAHGLAEQGHADEGAEQDTGADIYTLVRVSHIHLFGLTFIFFIVGFIFSHAYLRPLWLKHVIIVAPFAGVIADVLGWYVTKIWTPFAWMVLVAGAVNGLSFAAMWFISMYQMWLYKLPDHLALRQHKHDPDNRD